MKNKKHILTAVMVLAISAALILAGCSASVSNGSFKSEGAPMMPSASSMTVASDAATGTYYSKDSAALNDTEMNRVQSGAMVPFEGTTDTSAEITERKIIKHGDLNLETKEFDAALEGILKAVSNAGGYIQSQNINGSSLKAKYDYNIRSAVINARIPADKLDEVTASVGSICNVVYQRESIEDITDSYYDVETRLNTLRIQYERLTALLEKATDYDSIIKLTTAISDVQYQIDNYTGKLNRMNNQVSYSYLNINLTEVIEYTAIAETPKTFIQKLADSFKYSGRKIVNACENFLFWIIEEAPLVIINLALLLLIAWIIVKIVTRVFGKKISDFRVEKRKKSDKTLPLSPEEDKKDGEK